MVFNLLEIENKNSIFASGNACICTYNNNNKNNKKQKKKKTQENTETKSRSQVHGMHLA